MACAEHRPGTASIFLRESALLFLLSIAVSYTSRGHQTFVIVATSVLIALCKPQYGELTSVSKTGKTSLSLKLILEKESWGRVGGILFSQKIQCLLPDETRCFFLLVCF